MLPPRQSLSKALAGRGAGRAVVNNSNSELEGLFGPLCPWTQAGTSCSRTQTLQLRVWQGLREASVMVALPAGLDPPSSISASLNIHGWMLLPLKTSWGLGLTRERQPQVCIRALFTQDFLETADQGVSGKGHVVTMFPHHHGCQRN